MNSMDKYNISLPGLIQDVRELRDGLAVRPKDKNGIEIAEADLVFLNCENYFDRDLARVRQYRANAGAFNHQLKRGEVYPVNFEVHSVGSELRGVHPAMILTDIERFWIMQTIVVVPITSAGNTRDRILDKRSKPKAKWDSEAWSKVPECSTPVNDHQTFLDLQQLRVISPARICLDSKTGRPRKLRVITKECLKDVEESMLHLYGVKTAFDTIQKFENTMEAKQKNDRKAKEIRKHMLSVQSMLATLKDNPNLDAEHILGKALDELQDALDM